MNNNIGKQTARAIKQYEKIIKTNDRITYLQEKMMKIQKELNELSENKEIKYNEIDYDEIYNADCKNAMLFQKAIEKIRYAYKRM